MAKHPQTEIHRRMQAGESIPAWRPPELRSQIGLPEGVKAPLRHPEFLSVGKRVFIEGFEYRVTGHRSDTVMIERVAP